MTNKENIRQQKYKSFHYATDEEQKRLHRHFLDSLEQEHINTRTTKLLFPIVILAGGDTNYQNKYMEFEKKRTLPFGLIRT